MNKKRWTGEGKKESDSITGRGGKYPFEMEEKSWCIRQPAYISHSKQEFLWSMHPVLYVIDLYSFSSSSNTILNNPNITLNNNSLVEEQFQKKILEMNRWWRRKWFSKKKHLKGEDGLGFRVYPFEEKNLASIHIPLPLKNCILWSMHVLPLCLQQIHIPLTSQTQILNNSDNLLVEEEES